MDPEKVLIIKFARRRMEANVKNIFFLSYVVKILVIDIYLNASF